MKYSRLPFDSEWLTAWILRRRQALVIVTAIASVAAALQLPRLEFSGDIGAYVDGSNEDLLDFLDDTETFGSSETFVLVVEADDVLSPDVLKVIRRLSNTIRDDVDVERVVSITNLPFGLAELNRLETPSPDAREQLLANSYLQGVLVSPDGTQTQILAVGDALHLDAGDRLALAGRLRAYAVAEANNAIRISGTGPSMIALDAMGFVKTELVRLTWLAPALLGAAILFIFRGHPAVVAPVLVASLALLWTLGLFVATGNRITILLTMTPVVISIVTFADGVHILHKYYTEWQSTEDRTLAIRRTMALMNGACFMTSVTTSLGFLALYGSSSIAAVRLFALWTAIGVLVAYLLIIVLMPIMIAALPVPTQRIRAGYASGQSAAIIARLLALSRRRQLATPYLVILLMLLFGWGSTKIDVRTDLTQLMPASLPSIETLNRLKAIEQAKANLDLVITSPGQSFFENGRLAEVHALENALLDEFPELRSVHSITGAVESLHERKGGFGFPTDPAELEEYLLFVELTADEHWLRGFVSADYASVRLSVRLDHASARAAMDTINRIERWLSERVPENWTVRSSGAMKLFTINMRALVSSQFQSFLVAALVITMAVFFFIRDVRLTVISSIVNLFPVLLTLGVFPVLGLISFGAMADASLNLSTVMVPSVAMALAVDDTIHFLAYYRDGLSKGGTIDDRIGRAFQGAGFAILVTSFTMILGLSVLFFSDMPTNREFAVLLSFALFAAVLSDLILLPNFIRRWARNHAG